MAKQTFSVGQVLTAAQMTSLQQTAMGGGAASSKSANYVLVAADAGTTISMTSTSATTITVNTGLFSAGDTVFIQNLGSGTCTITAGTATVNTAGSLILPQYDAGILYFVSASSAIFYDYIQVGAASPLTTKGDLYTFSTSDTRLGVGANGTTLVADSSEATGLKWATPSSGGKTLLATTSLSGSSTSITSIDQTYKDLFLVGNIRTSTNTGITLRFNSNSTVGDYSSYRLYNEAGGSYNYNDVNGGDLGQSDSSTAWNNQNYTNLTIWRYAETEYKQTFSFVRSVVGGVVRGMYEHHAFNSTAAITSIQIGCGSGTLSGTVYLYGVK